jgi:hypothetical protein
MNVVAYVVDTDIRLLSAVNKHKVLLVSQLRRKQLYSAVTGLILTLTLAVMLLCALVYSRSTYMTMIRNKNKA